MDGLYAGDALTTACGGRLSLRTLRRVSAPAWTVADIPDLSGVRAVVTGATSGLGYVTALELARRHAEVVLAVRDEDKAAATAQAIRAAVPGGSVSIQPLDLASLASVRTAAAQLQSHGRIDLLVNNAGVMATPYRLTEDGFELQMGTNHLGPFALTALLLPLLRAADSPRVVAVSSMAHRVVRGIDLGDPRRHSGYSKWVAYGQSKLANLLFALELDRRSKAAGWGVTSVAAHPGWAVTELQTRGPKMAGSKASELGMRILNATIGQAVERGVEPVLMAATAAEVSGGSFVGPRWIARGSSRLERQTRTARDEHVAARLWEWSEAATGVSFR
jgi:NAD(P)-dependent dehydrogenase (short-subunit alcohol dehydrogenase family)